MSSARASRAACSGPAPPNATSVLSRGAWPCRAAASRTASAIVAITADTTACAAVGPSRPSVSASAPTAALAASWRAGT